ncbi:hypothetical protein ABKV19_020723 [Rosa sericea]
MLRITEINGGRKTKLGWGSSARKSVGVSRARTLGNIIVSVVGTGIFGLPFAFRIAGRLAGSLGVIVTGLTTYYCILLLVHCREKLESEEDSMVTKSYGDLGYECMGRKARYLTECLILIAQCGGSAAYLVFFGQNVSSIFNGHELSVASCIFLLVPVEIGFYFSFRDRTAITSNIGGLPFAGGMAVFCFEGLGMTLALEASMKDKTQFSRLLAQAFTGIGIVYALLGFFGYMAYSDQTRDIITLNLPQTWSSKGLLIGLCLGLVFAFPIMLHPINEIIEGNLTKDSSTGMGKLGVYMSRTMVVMVSAVLASCEPAFGVFTSLVGSTVCALISFVLPATFHLTLFGSSLQFWQKTLDFFILLCGLLFAVYGTYNAVGSQYLTDHSKYINLVAVIDELVLYMQDTDE